LLVTGGLGPTIDDLTRHALAAFLGKELVVDQEAERWMEGAVLARHGKRPRPSSAALLMAMVPEGTEALRNPVGVACGIRAARGRTTVMCVPGFPDEMRAMFEAYFLPMVMGDGSYERVLRVKRSETSMEPAFQAIAAEFGVRVASLPKRDWRLNGNVVVIKGDEGKVEAAAKKFLEMTASSAEE
jgi:nicotinamide-nucleotide amidase